jgi:hypothetical protein
VHIKQPLICLSLAEFAYNNTIHSASELLPFEALYGSNPLTPANLLTNNPTYAPLDVIAKIHDIRALISEQLKLADVYHATYYNRRAKPFEIAESDFVWLSTGNVMLHNQPCTKFCQRFNCPYAISANISSHAYRLRLLQSMQCHNIFHISNLRTCHSPNCPLDIFPGRIDAPHDEFITDANLDFRIAHWPDPSQRGPRLEILTHWDGYNPHSTHSSWEPFANLKHVEALPSMRAPTQLSPACSASLRTFSTTTNVRRAFRSQFRKTPQRLPPFLWAG